MIADAVGWVRVAAAWVLAVAADTADYVSERADHLANVLDRWGRAVDDPEVPYWATEAYDDAWTLIQAADRTPRP